MTQKPVILLPVDPSPWAIRVVDTGRILAEETGGRLHLFHVCPNPECTAAADWFIQLQKQCYDLELEVEIVNGNPGDQILQRSQTLEHLLLIVLGTHGETGNLEQLMGHVARQVIQEAHCPVVLTRRNMNIPIHLKHILLPLDGSPDSAAIVPKVAAIAEVARSEIDFLHVISAHAKLPVAAGQMHVPQYMDYPQHEWGAWEREFIERFFQPRKYIKAHIPVQLFMGHGAVDAAILQFARQHHADLIAMGWKGVLKEFRARILQEVLSQAPCPVMLYHVC